MSITTYSELQTSVANWLHRSDLTSIIPDLVKLGELRIFRNVRSREMETAFSGTIASGVIAVPTDYLELKFAYISSTPNQNLTTASASQIYDQYPLRTSSGKPKMIAREGANFIFGPYPDSGYTVGGIYYAKPTSIQTSANSLFLAHPDLYLFATLCECADYVKDDVQIQKWEAKLATIMGNIESQASNEYGSGGGLAVTVG